MGAAMLRDAGGMCDPGEAEQAAGTLVPVAWDGARMVDVCVAHLGVVARRAVGPLIAAGDLTLDGASARIAEPVAAGQVLGLAAGVLPRLASAGLLTPPSPVPPVVVHEDEDILVVDKPAGLHVHPLGRHRDDTLLGRVLWHVGARPGRPWTSCRPSLAHRLDRPTSGLVLLARRVEVRDRLQGLLERHEVVRTYQAVVHGQPAADAGRIDVPLGPDPADRRRRTARPVEAGGQVARTRWRVLRRDAGTALLELVLETGRTHQVRAHLAHLGHPIVGDVDYGAAATGPPADPRVGSAIALRAVELRLPRPTGGALVIRTAGLSAIQPDPTAG
jgi:23S rRNA pseudouridine1911/1915/1917 synthase